MSRTSQPTAKPTRSEGAIALKRTGLSAPQIAKRLGLKSDRGVSHWCSGRRKPQPGARTQLKKLFGIALAAWDVPAVLPRVSRLAPPDAIRGTTEHRIAVLSAMLDGVLNDPDIRRLPPIERIELYGQAARTLATLSKLTGEGSEILVAHIIRRPDWRRIERATSTALAPWPAALKAVRSALAELVASE